MTTTEHIVIYGILGDKPYRSKHRYTPEQAAEIRDITIKTAYSVIDEIAPGERKVWAEHWSPRHPMPNLRWSIQIVRAVKTEVEVTDVSDRTVLKIGIAVVVAVVIIAVVVAAAFVLR